MQWMLDLRTYGLKIHFNTTSRGHVEWCNGDELLYKSAQFRMAQFRGMVHGLVFEAQRVIREELLFCGGNKQGEMPAIDLNWLRDNPTDSRPGWNFLHDQRTRLPMDGKDWVFDRIGSNADIRQQFERSTSESGINRQGVEEYMMNVARFREKILVLMHIAGGQPARATELLSIRHSNTQKGGHRNIFIEDGMVVFVARYHKGYAMSGDVKIIHRYLPREIGELLVLYLWLILPFQQRMQAAVYQEDAMSSHIWPKDAGGKKWTSDRISKAMRNATMIGLGHALTIRDYREVAIGISRKFMRGTTSFQEDEGEDKEEDDIADEQAGHGSHVAGMVYARGVMEMAGVVMSKRRQFRTSSTDWHRFLGFASATEEMKQDGGKRKCPFELDADEGRFQRWKRLRSMDAVQEFKKMVKKDVGFRGNQEQAMEAIKAGVSPIVCVMPTGAGKSVLFMLPAWAEPGGTTIVVVPLIALRKDMMRRCEELGISCASWESRKPPDGESIVMVTPESAVSADFKTFINRLKATRQLDRVVIDECHVILNEQRDFRVDLQRLGQLVMAEAQMVLLTATLPPSKEAIVWERMGWKAGEITVFRMATVRKNVRYRVVKMEGNLRADQQDELVAQLVRKEAGKVVVYCNSRKRVDRLVASGLFECDGFHGRTEDKRKSEVLEAFRTGETRVVVATSALGMGVDIADIRLIIHADEPRDLLDYAQESGRAGRDGNASEAVVIAGVDTSEDSLVRRYLDDISCRRRIMDEFLDGVTGRVECGDEEESCDGCRVEVAIEEEEEEIEGDREQEEQEREQEEEEVRGQEDMLRREFEEQCRQRVVIRRRGEQQRRQEASDVDLIRIRLQEWKNVCVVCRGLGLEYGHVVTKCLHEIGRKAGAEVERRRRSIRLQGGRSCFKCGLPQSICD
jgi:superfamily II DNA helicase RecQ